MADHTEAGLSILKSYQKRTWLVKAGETEKRFEPGVQMAAFTDNLLVGG
jgi:hypothetical protein